MENTFCAFSGHRSLPRAAAEQLPRLLRSTIDSLAEEGFTGFLCGGALGFDTLAAEAVLSVRNRRPELTLTLALPCPEQDRAWPEKERARFRRILESADESILVSPEYHRYCMMQRNRFMVDRSRMLVCYLTGDKGGTAATVRYALQRGRDVVNLALDIE
ncbi:MAG: DUF1273 family protein [Oscillospiraceae bacterium]|nr:DUF1273 family protein [Oscillospiraceae bacterium]